MSTYTQRHQCCSSINTEEPLIWAVFTDNSNTVVNQINNQAITIGGASTDPVRGLTTRSLGFSAAPGKHLTLSGSASTFTSLAPKFIFTASFDVSYVAQPPATGYDVHKVLSRIDEDGNLRYRLGFSGNDIVFKYGNNIDIIATDIAGGSTNFSDVNVNCYLWSSNPGLYCTTAVDSTLSESGRILPWDITLYTHNMREMYLK